MQLFIRYNTVTHLKYSYIQNIWFICTTFCGYKKSKLQNHSKDTLRKATSSHYVLHLISLYSQKHLILLSCHLRIHLAESIRHMHEHVLYFPYPRLMTTDIHLHFASQKSDSAHGAHKIFFFFLTVSGYCTGQTQPTQLLFYLSPLQVFQYSTLPNKKIAIITFGKGTFYHGRHAFK